MTGIGKKSKESTIPSGGVSRKAERIATNRWFAQWLAPERQDLWLLAGKKINSPGCPCWADAGLFPPLGSLSASLLRLAIYVSVIRNDRLSQSLAIIRNSRQTNGRVFRDWAASGRK
jgi:hypothetical protein